MINFFKKIINSLFPKQKPIYYLFDIQTGSDSGYLFSFFTSDLTIDNNYCLFLNTVKAYLDTVFKKNFNYVDLDGFEGHILQFQANDGEKLYIISRGPGTNIFEDDVINENYSI